jgi:hypothetical protein
MRLAAEMPRDGSSTVATTLPITRYENRSSLGNYAKEYQLSKPGTPYGEDVGVL